MQPELTPHLLGILEVLSEDKEASEQLCMTQSRFGGATQMDLDSEGCQADSPTEAWDGRCSQFALLPSSSAFTHGRLSTKYAFSSSTRLLVVIYSFIVDEPDSNLQAAAATIWTANKHLSNTNSTSICPT